MQRRLRLLPCVVRQHPGHRGLLRLITPYSFTPSEQRKRHHAGQPEYPRPERYRPGRCPLSRGLGCHGSTGTWGSAGTFGSGSCPASTASSGSSASSVG
ncbi:thiocillin family RiPP [Kocuria atrinae]|uniref:thiocillin family RiPP n=1 Tax=Kocuria atrinae TaxID=592377 RepID=UPI0037C190F7